MGKNERYGRIEYFVGELFSDERGVAPKARTTLVSLLQNKNDVACCLETICTKLWEFKKNEEFSEANRGKLWFSVSLLYGYGTGGENFFTRKVRKFGYLDKLKSIRKNIANWEEWKNIPSLQFMIE